MTTTLPELDKIGIVGYQGLNFIGAARYCLGVWGRYLSCSELAEMKFKCVDEICQHIATEDFIDKSALQLKPSCELALDMDLRAKSVVEYLRELTLENTVER
jgi:hypothetical protein